MRLPLVCRLVLVGSVLGQTVAAFADDSRLAVVGTARIEQRPDIMEVVANVAASGTMSGDALKKFRANRRRGIEAITKLKIKGLEVKGGGMSGSCRTPSCSRCAIASGMGSRAAMASRPSTKR